VAKTDQLIPASKTVSGQMRRMPTKNSNPELRIRKALHARGLRYQLHRKDLPGKPDISFGPAKLAVFVDGCYWHNCPEHGTIPKNNREWWIEKFEQNRYRDRRKDQELEKLGWLPIHVWEHEDPRHATEKIQRLIIQRTGI
jgi:DNA mismatch endonuclease (patch repair protein)